MSADDYWLIRKHPNGGYAAVHAFMSDDDQPDATPEHEQFDGLELALIHAIFEESEYGPRLHPELGITEAHAKRMGFAATTRTNTTPASEWIENNTA